MSDHDSFVAAWQSDSQTRQLFVSEVTRELSKTGSLEAFEDHLSMLVSHMSKDDVVGLFAEFQKSKRPEFEWKQDFLAIFSNVDESDLPASIVDDDEARRVADEARQASELQGKPQSGYPDVPF